jgi:hypothetical protein
MSQEKKLRLEPMGVCKPVFSASLPCSMSAM